MIAGGLEALRDAPLLKAVHGVAVRSGRVVYLVGGTVRNAVMSRPLPLDYDFAADGDVKALALAAADALEGSPFILDKEAPSYRVAVKAAGAAYTLDFSPIDPGGIVRDLEARDFTVNAMAVRLDGVFARTERAIRLLDPRGGLKDSMAGVLRMTSRRVFDEDPARCLRALRLSQQYGLRVTAATMRMIGARSGLLKGVAPERVRDELQLIFRHPDAGAALAKLFSTGIMDAVLPETSSWGPGLVTHALRTIGEAEALLSGLDSRADVEGRASRLRDHFGSRVGAATWAEMLKVSALLHDAGKPLTETVDAEGRTRYIGHDLKGSVVASRALKRLRFSRAATRELTGLVRNHHRVFSLAAVEGRTDRARAHFFRASGGAAGLTLLYLALADSSATRGAVDPEIAALVEEMTAFYYGVYLSKRPKPLLNGTDVMKVFGVPEGPMVGEILARVSEEVEAGALKDRRQAIEFVKRWLSGRRAAGLKWRAT
jgi:tRNA nucleotidyltransferase/poly(A) polymerase